MSSVVPLTQAVTSGDANAVRAALATGADVNERNNGGQTALILAVIFGHTDLVRLLVKSGANPHLRDNLGLDAIEWAQRRGLPMDLFAIAPPAPPPKPQTDTDEKSRRWLAGVKQRIQEQSAQQPQVVAPPAPVIQPEPPPPKPEPTPEPVIAAPPRQPEPEPERKAATRKRCPKCNAIYNSELVAYCAHHFVRLVDADEPFFEPTASTTNAITSSPLLWMLVLATVSVAAFTGYMIATQLSRVIIPDSAANAQQQPRSYLKGTPVAGGDLAGRALTLSAAECPVFDGDPLSRADEISKTVNVRVKLDKGGKVYWARAEGGNEALRNAATEAATQSTFSADKSRPRETEGTITYTFAP
ncbi:MAG TPA: ankyrin repeat domain-containing protein [Pyrinomonadaceae bacterium]|nr:ankyrin repeat domain-containing protein [Pyrinomonadaceae bacterium]